MTSVLSDAVYKVANVLQDERFRVEHVGLSKGMTEKSPSLAVRSLISQTENS